MVVLTAYGYQSLGQTSYKNHRLYSGDKEAFLRAYLDDRRAEEFAILRQLAPHARLHPGKLWMLTLVAKQDLWWPKRSDVEDHYRQGEYGAEVDRLTAGRNPKQFRHECVFASLVINNFKTGMGELLEPNAAGYDHRAQVESLRRLFETVHALKEWESAPWAKPPQNPPPAFRRRGHPAVESSTRSSSMISWSVDAES